MRFYQVPAESIRDIDPQVSDGYRLTALHCLTVVLRWQAEMEMKSRAARNLALGFALGVAFTFVLTVLL